MTISEIYLFISIQLFVL